MALTVKQKSPAVNADVRWTGNLTELTATLEQAICRELITAVIGIVNHAEVQKMNELKLTKLEVDTLINNPNVTFVVGRRDYIKELLYDWMILHKDQRLIKVIKGLLSLKYSDSEQALGGAYGRGWRDGCNFLIKVTVDEIRERFPEAKDE